MKITKPLPPQDFAVRVAVETVEGLKLYQRYQKEACATKWEIKEMAGVILSTFLAEGDPEFLAWRKRQPRAAGPLTLAAAPTPADANGATDD